MKRLDRVFGTLVGWLIGLGMVAFAIVGFSAINQATPLSATNYLTGASAAQTGGANAGGPSTPSTQASSSGKSSISSSNSSGNTSSGSPSGKTSKPPSQAQLVTMGQTIIAAKCEACHVINGKGGAVGPNLDDVMAGKSVPGLAPGSQPTNKAWLAKWIANPQGVWSSAVMPNLGLNPTQVQAVVAYLTTKVK